MKKIIIVLFLLPVILSFSIRGHFWITKQSFDHFPEIMAAFGNRFYEPVTAGIPPYYMYPDIHEAGHTNEMLAKNTESHYRSLVAALSTAEWEAAEVEIGYIAHYCGDAASPTQNSSDTWGTIDDRYDLIVDLYIDDIPLHPIVDEPLEILDINRYLLNRCQQALIWTDTLMTLYHENADNYELWKKSRPIYEQQMNLAVGDLRNVLYTAWNAAGRPDQFSGSGGGCTSFFVIDERKTE